MLDKVSDDETKLREVADIAHEFVMKGGRPGRIQAMAAALGRAGYDMTSHPESSDKGSCKAQDDCG